MHRSVPAVVLTVAVASACKPPPPAPEGLDASARYMVRNFYSDDATFQAGIQGYVDWFENGGGKELVGAVPSDETPVNAFQVTTLAEEDLVALPLDDEIVLEPNNPNDTTDDELGPRDLTRAIGVVSVEVMNCSWKRAEELLALSEQDAVFYHDWEAYQRTYATSRTTFEDAREADSYTAIDATFDPHGDGFDREALAKSLLFTDNIADPANVPIVGNLPPFPLILELRHGQFELPDSDGPVGVLAILTYAPAAFWGDQGKNGFRQSYSIELNVEQPDGTTLRMLAIWNEPEILGVDPDSDIAKSIAVNKSQNSSKDMREVCEGVRTLDL